MEMKWWPGHGLALHNVFATFQLRAHFCLCACVFCVCVFAFTLFSAAYLRISSNRGKRGVGLKFVSKEPSKIILDFWTLFRSARTSYTASVCPPVPSCPATIFPEFINELKHCRQASGTPQIVYIFWKPMMSAIQIQTKIQIQIQRKYKDRDK